MIEDPAGHPVSLLLVLDGWGYREETEANAIAQADTPVWDRLWRDAPHTLIACSGSAVGLPEQQMGSSEVGHMNLGAGRVVRQELTEISEAISRGDLMTHALLRQALTSTATTGSALHVMGLLSSGGVHSHEQHIHELIKVAAESGVQRIFVHGFLDGRDTPPRSAEAPLKAMDDLCRQLSAQKPSCQARMASLCGRYFAMDRDKRWERTQCAYNLLVAGEADRQAADATAGLLAAYDAGESDEFVRPTALCDNSQPAPTIQDGDLAVFMNFRADRARQLTQAFIDSDFDGFDRPAVPSLASFITLTRYSEAFDTPAVFPPRRLENTLGEYLSALNKRQLRIAETEKYAHVTFFFNGGQEAPYPQEDRILIASPKVATYDLQPQMSAHEVTDEVVRAIEENRYDLIVCNFANSDMVGHTGIFKAALRAVETIDNCLGRILTALEKSNPDSQCLITADHGNVELMEDQHSHQPHTAHTCAPVPLIYAGRRAVRLRSGGRLADVAPTLLALMGLQPPPDMTGQSLLLQV